MAGFTRDLGYELPKVPVNAIADPGHNDFDKFSRELIDMRESMFLTGYPGSGKSTLARKMIAKLKGKHNVLEMAPTNVARNVLGKNAVTCHKFFMVAFTNMARFKASVCKYDWAVVDEVSMLHEPFYFALTIMKQM